MITIIKLYLMTHLSIDCIDHLIQWCWTFQRTHLGIIILLLFYCVSKDSLVLISLILFNSVTRTLCYLTILIPLYDSS